MKSHLINLLRNKEANLVHMCLRFGRMCCAFLVKSLKRSQPQFHHLYHCYPDSRINPHYLICKIEIMIIITLPLCEDERSAQPRSPVCRLCNQVALGQTPQYISCRSWDNLSTAPTLSFPICIMGIVIMPISNDYYGNQIK